MPKPHTYPTLYNETLQIHISKLKEWGYLTPGQIKSSTLTWSSNGNPTGSISIQVNTHSEQPYIELDYKYRDEPRNYKLYLTSTPSNLGKGEIWYFLCPHTKKRCRKLYLIGGYFLHREAFKGCMYECQTLSKDSREWRQALNLIFKREDLLNILHAKHFKSTYAGKPTKRYLKIMHLIQDIENRRS
ncbi:MAG: hypothetical protein CVT99_15455 [Bacteroidetes bacterium HGW-Bacteroidetes-16]|jgi:hypothetical protein|nr:MAG: hypothetical protein CVT99_15455 [Bacteroidetes bacterium HGW-Bacteroidetes-16]